MIVVYVHHSNAVVTVLTIDENGINLICGTVFNIQTTLSDYGNHLDNTLIVIIVTITQRRLCVKV